LPLYCRGIGLLVATPAMTKDRLIATCLALLTRIVDAS
jgi:hypothetical protein